MTTNPVQPEAPERFTEMEFQIIRQTFSNCVLNDGDTSLIAKAAECEFNDVIDLMRKLGVGSPKED